MPEVRVDVHQHVWTQPLIDALAARRSRPRVARVGSEAIVEIPGEPSYVVDLDAESPAERLALLDRDGLDLAVVAMSCPIGIEALPRAEAQGLIEVQLSGVQALGPRFAAWGPIALDRPDPDDVDRILARGCLGISIPAGALVNPRRLASMAPVLKRIADCGVPLFVHPGPGAGESVSIRGEAGWWTPMTSYVSQMQSAWLTFAAQGRSDHPRLIVLFAMLAGVAPLLSERLSARGGPVVDVHDPLTFYDTSSFGPVAIDAMAQQGGERQLIYGSDRPVIEPVRGGPDVRLQENGARVLAGTGCPA